MDGWEGQAVAIDVTCPCSMKFRAKTELAGQRVKCPGCGKPVVVPVPHMEPIVVDEEEPLLDEPAGPSIWSRIGRGIKRAATIPPRPEPRPEPPPPPHKPVRFTRACLGWVAAISFLSLTWCQVFPALSEAEYSSQLAYAKYKGDVFEVSEFKRERLRKVDAVAADARTAWVAFAVAMTGLACSKP